MQPPQSQSKKVFTVSALNRLTKEILDTQLPLLWVEGEISNLSIPSSGHWYFTLKDPRAQVKCAMFRGKNARIKFKPKAGDKVLLRAKASLYEGRGDFQLIAEHMEPAGLGDLQRRFELLKATLNEEGLFDQTYKKALPHWPEKLGVITSATGAAVRDVMQVIKRRYPSLELLIIPVSVQGEDSANEVVQAIKVANQNNLCDVLLLTRGGGSIEDLWSFNEESVARSIFNSLIPVVSAIGHETDFTIADFVADLRAPTPSAAAEMITPDCKQISQTFANNLRALQKAVLQKIQYQRQLLENQRGRLKHPGQTLATQTQRLDQLELSMTKAIRQQLQDSSQLLDHQHTRLMLANPKRVLSENHIRLQSLIESLHHIVDKGQELKRQRLEIAANLLNNLSPLNTLSRGYAILRDTKEKIVAHPGKIKVGDTIGAQLAAGHISCEVKKLEFNNDD